jgi:hypothetical protein
MSFHGAVIFTRVKRERGEGIKEKEKGWRYERNISPLNFSGISH